MTQPNEQRMAEIREKSQIGRVVRVQANTVHDLMADIRFLLKENQRLEHEKDQLRENAGAWERKADKLARELEQVKAERDRLRQGMDVNISLGTTIIAMQEEIEALREYVGMYAAQGSRDALQLLNRFTEVYPSYPPREKGAET